jgi:hypothetical protein
LPSILAAKNLGVEFVDGLQKFGDALQQFRVWDIAINARNYSKARHQEN